MNDGILLGESALMGETVEELETAERAGVIYRCPINDGTCPQGQHTGEGFFHYHPGKTPDDYDDALGY